MKKFMRFMLLLSIGFLSFEGYSQFTTLRGGLNFSEIRMKYTDNPEQNESSNFKPGFHFGVTFDIPFTSYLGLETGILLNTKGGSYKGTWDSYKLNFVYTEIPLSLKAKFKLGDKTRLYTSAGGYFGVRVLGFSRYKFDGESSYELMDFNHKVLDYGATFGTGLEFERLAVGVSYDMGLANMYYSDYMKITNSVFKLSVGLRLGKDK
jgi:hypothetical protein